MKNLILLLGITLMSTSVFASMKCECWGYKKYNNWSDSGKWKYVSTVYASCREDAVEACIDDLDRHGKYNYINYGNYWLRNCRYN